MGVLRGNVMRKASVHLKAKTSVALDKNLLVWVDKMVETKRFATRTHAIEYALQRLKESGA
jgi:Arc/MetJ-type ribon-helix-helix transcriptional regulator